MKINITTLLYEVLASLPTGDPGRDKIGSAINALESMVHAPLNPGDYVLYDEKIARVVWVAHGRSIGMRFESRADAPRCPHCGRDMREAHGADVSQLDGSPLFKEKVRKIVVMKEGGL